MTEDEREVAFMRLARASTMMDRHPPHSPQWIEWLGVVSDLEAKLGFYARSSRARNLARVNARQKKGSN